MPCLHASPNAHAAMPARIQNLMWSTCYMVLPSQMIEMTNCPGQNTSEAMKPQYQGFFHWNFDQIIHGA